ncbi:hypothetical protein OG590_39990 (plasmid) [Streptomyces goshikiensis]|uniref:hypothetical protein n=1 Tax=Streptomyces goshikiensis TaxID=1942 RepID=UPI002F90CF2E|nr:hypothetical protein OG590_39990 [Streptomyces goshikiensis]
MNAWDKQVESVFNLARQAVAHVNKQIGGKPQARSLVQQRADQVMSLAKRGDKAGLDQLIRSWPTAEARQVQAEIERR